MKMKKVSYSSKSISDIAAIFIGNKASNLKFAHKEKEKIKTAISRIRKNPYIGNENLDERGRLYILPVRYKILYRVIDDVIYIDRVFL